MADITIHDLTEITEVTDSHYLAVDSGTATTKISVENFNATATASAAEYAQAAADSASAASDSEDAAKGYKETVEQAINDASTIVSNAQTYANAAELSKNDASGYASAASTSATQAATSAGQAASYATGVQAYATEAKSWAEGGTGTRVDEETTNCEYYANAAHTAETNAAASESNAASSESNAATSETNAATSENNALGYANAASASALKSEGYAVGTQNGTPAASGDPYYQDNAKYYKEEAATSASNASTSETNAGLSETAASGYADAADDSAEDSEAWAVGTRDGVDVPSTDPAYHNNAKYWADVAAGGVSGVSSFNGRSGNVVPASGDYAANIIEYVNTSSGLAATDVQDAIDELDSDLGTLDSSLATVAKTGAYSDLSGKPTLGTAAAKNATSSVTSGSTDLVEGGAVHSALADKMDKANPTGSGALSLNRKSGTTVGVNSVAIGNNITASGENSVAEGYLTTASTNNAHAEGEVTEARATNAHAEGYHTQARYANQHVMGSFNDNKANTYFEVGNGTDANNRSNAFEVYSDGTVSVDNGTTKVNLSIIGKKLTAQTLAVGSTTLTFTDSSITTDSTIEIFASVYGIAPESVTVTTGQAVLTFDAQESAVSVYLIVR